MKYRPTLFALALTLLTVRPTWASQHQLLTTNATILYLLLSILLILLIIFALDKKRTSNLAKESDERHKSILQIALDGIYTTDSQGNIIEVNDTYCNMSGYSRKELLTMNISQLEAKETAEQVLAHHQRLQHLSIETFQSQQRKKDGSLFDVEIGLKFLPEGGGKTIAFVQDITERKRAEKEQIRKQYTMDKAHEIALIGAWEYNIATEKPFLSDQAYRICQIPAGTKIDIQLLQNRIHPEDRRQIAYALINAIKQGTSFDLEHRLIIGDDIKWVRSIGHSISDSAGEIKEIIGVTQDITNNKQLMEDYRRSAQLAALGTVAAGVAHEINNPIQGILNYAGILKESRENNNRTTIIAERIEKESLRIAKITQDLLYYSRDSSLDFKLVDIAETVEGALTLMRRKIRKQGIDLQVNYQKELPKLTIQPQSIQQVVINLLDNSCDALAEKTNQHAEKKILLKISSCQRTDTDYVCISVCDNGDGMSEETRNNAQEAFFTTKPMGKGTGLGLSIVSDIAKKHHAKIEIESIPGQFTEVRFLLQQIN
jgi:PAS domain S-box-containing protein